VITLYGVLETNPFHKHYKMSLNCLHACSDKVMHNNEEKTNVFNKIQLTIQLPDSL